MIRNGLLFGLILFTATLVAANDRLPPEVIDFLQSREVVVTIEFAEGEARLSRAAMQTIDSIAERLKQLDPTKTLVRVEGVASKDGSESVNIPISMTRAKAVMDYLREAHSFAADLSMTGFGAASSGSLVVEPGCRADIAFYDNPWDMPDVSLEKVVGK